MRESTGADRDAALRRLLVDRVDAEGRRAVPAAGAGAGARGARLRTGLVSGAVLVAVVAGSAAVITTAHDARVGATRPHPAESQRWTSVPAPTPSATPTRTLIGKRGAEVRTRAGLSQFAEQDPDLKGNPVWQEQAWIEIRCMASKGFLYDPITEMQGGETASAHDGLTAAQERTFDTAFYGDSSSGSYDWRTAGCDGLAVHETGQDDSH